MTLAVTAAAPERLGPMADRTRLTPARRAAGRLRDGGPGCPHLSQGRLMKKDDFVWMMINPLAFCTTASGVTLRRYQEQVLTAVLDSIYRNLGLTFVVMFPRQSGKNELQAQLEVFLLALYERTGMEIVKVSPTWKPQSLNAMRRLERVLSRNRFTRRRWMRESGYIYRVGDARIFFLSGEPHANIVGATASLLLEVDEAQDVLTAKYDKEIAPMAAANNVTRVLWGTAWTSQTLLARELRAARRAEALDGIQRAFVLTAEDVAAEVPAYGAFVAEQVAKLGRQNPSVRSQFFSEEIDVDGGLFPAGRLALMAGTHGLLDAPRAGQTYAMLLDVAGAEEGGMTGLEANPGRDATALTVVEVDFSAADAALAGGATYRVVQRRLWLGVPHAQLYRDLLGLAQHWRVRWLVVDATGVGAGLSGFLSRALPGRVIPFVFSRVSKSKLGWDFLGLVDAGRWREPAQGGALDDLFQQQLRFCQFEIAAGPEHYMRWGVPDGTRDPISGELVHDDLLMSAAMASLLDGQTPVIGSGAAIIRAADPLDGLDRGEGIG